MCVVAACALGVQAAVSLPDLFGDHALLQRDAATAVWGHGNPGERVTVKLGGARAEAKTAADGWWIARLDT